MSRPLSLRAEGIRRRFRRSGFELAVDGLEASAGEALALLGPSGSGKSTLLHILGLLERPDAGVISLDGRPVSSRDRAARSSIAAVFQRPYLFKGSVAANVAYGLDVRGVRGAERERRVAGALGRVGLDGFGGRSALSLSGGEAQRVSLARALVIEPSVLLLDEPLASLDTLLRRKLIRDFASIVREADTTVIYVTHDQDEALVIADRLAVLDHGRIVTEGPTDYVHGLVEDEWTASFFGVVPAASGVVVGEDAGLMDVQVNRAHVTVVGDAPVGSKVALSIQPQDVILYSGDELPPASSARNRFLAHVTDVDHRGSTVVASLESSGLRFAASVSRVSARELGIDAGVPVYAAFKATAVRWRIRAEAQGADMAHVQDSADILETEDDRD